MALTGAGYVPLGQAAQAASKAANRVVKFNHNHDERGRFATAEGAGAATRHSVSNVHPSDQSGENSTQLAAGTTKNFNYARKVLGLDPIDASQALHAAKSAAGLSGADVCTFDLETGDIFYNGELIGNLGD